MNQDKHTAENIIVIYNKFDIDAVISAAFLKSALKLDKVYDNLSNLQVDEKCHHYLLGFNKISKKFTDRYNYVTLTYTTCIEKGESSILNKILTYFKYDEDGVGMKIAQMLPEFNTTVDGAVLLNLYSHYKKALNTLSYNDKFSFNDEILSYGAYSDISSITQREDILFKRFMIDVKRDMERYHSNTHVAFLQQKLEISAASICNDNCTWVRRMMLMSQKRYLNVVLSVRGLIIDTDRSDISAMLPNCDFTLSNEI